MSQPTPETTSAPAPAHPPLWTNWISLGGFLLAAMGLVLMLTFWLFNALSPLAKENVYLNVIGFMILPGIFMNGLILVPIGMFLRKRKFKKYGPIKHISAKKAFTFLGITFFLVLPILGVAGYQGYHFTESAEFCGTVCHNMDPQYMRYQQSAHAHATCAGCHIGPGASPFVKSKLSGLRQVFHTIKDDFPRPIPPAIHELRPARDTCEDCHWPNRFFGAKLKKIPHYAPDEKNSLNTYEVLLKVGGVNNHLGQAEGIHMHMLDRVEYISEDKRIETIPWVRYTYPDSTVRVFRSDGRKSSEPAPAGHPKTLDCIDCHNASGHEFLSPERAVDHELSVGRLDTSLPYIKREAVRILASSFKDREDGLAKISSGLTEFYSSKLPEVYASRKADVDKAIGIVRDIYTSQMFPEMKVDWRTYPSHIGHLESPGCFRCHDGLHVSDDGKRISMDCASCHTFLYRTQDKDGTEIIREKKFEHPNRIHSYWKDLGPHKNMICTDCHDGGLGAIGWRDTLSQNQCGDCHPSGRWIEMQKQIQRREAIAGTQPSTRPTTPATQWIHPHSR